MFNILHLFLFFFFLRITICETVSGKLVPGLIAPNLLYANGPGAMKVYKFMPSLQFHVFMF